MFRPIPPQPQPVDDELLLVLDGLLNETDPQTAHIRVEYDIAVRLATSRGVHPSQRGAA
jgi:hypothetical protein